MAACTGNITKFWMGLLVHQITAGKYSAVHWNWKSYTQIVMAIIGIVGNSLVICVYLRKLRFHIATNTLILNLAVADLLGSIFIIPLPKVTQIGEGPFSEIYCSLAWSGVLLWIAIVASIYTLTMLSVERYLAVIYPIKYRLLFVGARPKIVIISIWILSAFVNLYITFVAKNSNGICIVKWPNPAFQAIFGVFLFLAEFFIPMLIMLVSHVRTIFSLRTQAETILRSGSARNSPSMALLRTRRKVIETLFVVVVTFIICWLPDQLAYMLYNIGVLETEYLSTHLYEFFVLLAFLNSCVNPIIYTFKNKEFRHSLKVLLRVRKRNQIHATNDNPIVDIRSTAK
ncbi:somatostatin receptor type 4-like [Amphiura filiformis]|uniref:somatostatin receptor type 4-like n=1 Tax=Amphiura filiformis TaxID=82378 RepID=UPI003B217E27